MLVNRFMDDCFKIFYITYFQPDYYKPVFIDWISSGYFTRIDSIFKTMCFWIDKLSDINTYLKPFENHPDINEMLQEFNKAVINEIENFRIKSEKSKCKSISFNEAAMIWIDGNYKEFKTKWFETHCEHYCKNFFDNIK